MNNEVIKEIEKGYKRMAIICCVWMVIFAIPLLIGVSFIETQYIRQSMVLVWLITVIIGVLLSPKIVNKIWKK